MEKIEKQQPTIKREPPTKIYPHNVMYWEPHSMELIRIKKDGSKEAGSILKKAKILLEEDCIKKVDRNEWKILPVEGYNKTTYKVVFNGRDLTCNCQGYNSKLKRGDKGICSHTIGVEQFEYMEGFNGGI